MELTHQRRPPKADEGNLSLGPMVRREAAERRDPELRQRGLALFLGVLPKT